MGYELVMGGAPSLTATTPSLCTLSQTSGSPTWRR